MKNYILLLLCVIFTISSVDTFAGGKKGKSNVYIGKRYKGHKCPPKRKIINAKYF
jgi:hypothetical protein